MALSKGSPGQNKLTLPQLFRFHFFLLDTPEAHLLFMRGIAGNKWKNVMVKAYYCINIVAKA